MHKYAENGMKFPKEIIKKAKELKRECGRASRTIFQRKFNLSSEGAQILVDLINKPGSYEKISSVILPKAL